MPSLVFVFGTLKEGFPNFHVNRGRRVPGDFVTVNAYPFYLVGERRSPWLLDQPREGNNVIGQVFEVDEAALGEMDVLERVDRSGGYLRRTIEVQALGQPGPTTRLSVFAYLKDPVEFREASTDAIGPLHEYTPEHAALYRSRGVAKRQ